MKKYSDLLQLVQILNAFSQEQNTKGGKKLKKISELIQPHLDAFNDKKDDLRLDACSTDNDGNLILNEKGDYTFNKEGVRKLNTTMRDLLLTKIDFSPIKITSSEGLENFTFLDGWVDGISFNKLEEEEIEL